MPPNYANAANHLGPKLLRYWRRHLGTPEIAMALSLLEDHPDQILQLQTWLDGYGQLTLKLAAQL
jgi:hypothetical protein